MFDYIERRDDMKLNVFDLLFTSVDQRFRQIGFKKIEETKISVRYERENGNVNDPYVHVIAMYYRPNGKHWIQSYEKEVRKDCYNSCVALTAYELKLILKKIKEKRWVIRK